MRNVPSLSLSTRCLVATALMALAAPLAVAQVGLPNLSRLAYSDQPVPATYFGMHIHRAATTTAWPSVPFGSWRLWDAHAAWPNVEPQPGKWDFTNIDKYLALAEEHHVEVDLPLGLTPHWASARPDEKSAYGPGLAAEPQRMEDWDTYVRTVAQHCKGRVAAYEIWNEPNFNIFWSGTTDQLVEMTRRARAIIKSIDPGALLVSPSPTKDVQGLIWLNDFLNKGGGSYVDVIGYHLYSRTPELMAGLAVQVRQVMKEHGVGDLQLWNTETGWAKPKPFPSPELAAGYLARTYLLNWAAGVQRLFWYAWDNHNFVSIETTEPDERTPTPAGLAYGVVYRWMQGSRLKSCTVDANHTWICDLVGPASEKWVVWNADGNTTMPMLGAWHSATSFGLNGGETSLDGPALQVTQIPHMITRGH